MDYTNFQLIILQSKLVKIHLELLMPIVPAGSLILEPARGKGAYYDYFQLAFPTSQYDYCEIDEGKDFLEYSIGNSPDVIITNPPFSLLKQFIKSLMALDGILEYSILSHSLAHNNGSIAFELAASNLRYSLGVKPIYL